MGPRNPITPAVTGQQSGRSDAAPAPFRHKTLATLAAAVGGALGIHRLYLGQRFWWLPLGVTVIAIPWLIGVANWYRTPAFFIAMVPVTAGFIEALVLALTPDAAFDTRFNPACGRQNHSGWATVILAVATLLVGATVLLTVIALFSETLFS